MSFTVFLGNLPVWVTADDIKGWLSAENLVADAIKVIRNPETQESKGFAFIEAPNAEEMNSIIRRFDRAPLEDRLLRANPAQPPKPKGIVRPAGGAGAPTGSGMGPVRTGGYTGPQAGAQGVPQGAPEGAGQNAGQSAVQNAAQGVGMDQRPPRARVKRPGGGAKRGPSSGGPQSAFAEELAKAL